MSNYVHVSYIFLPVIRRYNEAGVNMRLVTTHEIGHSLGLEHNRGTLKK